MKRRTVIKSFLFYSIAANTIIACKSKNELLSKLGLKNLNLHDEEIENLDALINEILPTDGVKMFEGHTALPHVLSMMDRLYEKPQQEKLLKGFQEFCKTAKQELGSDFQKVDAENKLNFLKKLDSSKDNNDLTNFYQTVKSQTIHYFTTTEQYMRSIKKYEMAPGRWIACVKIDNIKTELR